MTKYTTEQFQRRKRLRRYWRISLVVVFFLTVIGATVFWSGHDFFETRVVEVVGNKFVSTEKIFQIIDEKTSGKNLLIFDKKNFIFLPVSQIVSRIENEVPVDSVKLHRIGLNKIKIDITEQKPWALWCSEFDDENCFFVNAGGLIFAQSPEFIFDKLITLTGPILGGNDVGREIIDGIVGQVYTDSTVFSKLVTIEELLKKIDIEIRAMSTTDHDTFYLNTRAGPYLLIDKNDDPIEIVNNLKTTLEQESIHDIQFANLEYIDLRFDGRAYYKVK